MIDYVVDSSVVVKWVLAESDSNVADHFASDVLRGGHQLVVLDLAIIEVSNAIWKQFHRKLASFTESQAFLALLPALPLNPVRALRLLDLGRDLAWKYDCAVYDALFVAACVDLKLPGITADEPLWKAVKSDLPQISLLRDWPLSTP